MKIWIILVGLVVASVQIFAGHEFTSPTTGHRVIVTETTIVTFR